MLFCSTYTNNDLSLRWELSRKACQKPWKRIKKKERYKWREWGDRMEHKSFQSFLKLILQKRGDIDKLFFKKWQYIQFCCFNLKKTFNGRNILTSLIGFHQPRDTESWFIHEQSHFPKSLHSTSMVKYFVLVYIFVAAEGLRQNNWKAIPKV